MTVGFGTLLRAFKQFSRVLHVGICLVPIKPESAAFGVHVRLAKRERINVRLVLQVRQGVVDEPVCGFVGTDGIYHI